MLLEALARTLDELVETEPAGAARAEAAYNSVGLGFWSQKKWQVISQVRKERRRQAAMQFLFGALAACMLLWYLSAR